MYATIVFNLEPLTVCTDIHTTQPSHLFFFCALSPNFLEFFILNVSSGLQQLKKTVSALPASQISSMRSASEKFLRKRSDGAARSGDLRNDLYLTLDRGQGRRSTEVYTSINIEIRIRQANVPTY